MANDPAAAGPADSVHLVLYVSGLSGPSVRAIANLEKLLADYAADHVRLEVCDLAKGYPPHAEEDQIAFTPTLVKRRPEPRAWIIGTLENADVVRYLLTSSGVGRKV